VWGELSEKSFHNKTFDTLDALEDHLVDAPRALEMQNRRIKSIAASEWIIDAVSMAN
jgi:hypothetical protein